MAKIPKFKNLEEAAAFWDVYDFEDYREETEPVAIAVKIRRRKKVIAIPLDLKLYQQIEGLAAKRGVPIERLVSAWLKDKAKSETAQT